jgi:hypothetical protein
MCLLRQRATTNVPEDELVLSTAGLIDGTCSEHAA